MIELDGDGYWSPISGVAAEAVNTGLAGAADYEYYRLMMDSGTQVPWSAVAILRTPRGPAMVNGWIKPRFAAPDPTLPVTVQSFGDGLRKLRGLPRFVAAVATYPVSHPAARIDPAVALRFERGGAAG